MVPEGGSGVMRRKHPDPGSELEPASWKEIEKRSEYYGLQQLNTQLGVLKTLACFETIVPTPFKVPQFTVGVSKGCFM